MAGVGVGLVADLHRLQPRPEGALRGSHLAGGGFGVVVGEADREEDPPPARLGEPAEHPEVGRVQQLRRPRGRGGVGVGPSDLRIRGDAAEAQNPRAERAEQADEVAALPVFGDLAEVGHLEGQAEIGGGDGPSRVPPVDPHRYVDMAGVGHRLHQARRTGVPAGARAPEGECEDRAEQHRADHAARARTPSAAASGRGCLPSFHPTWSKPVGELARGATSIGRAT